MKWYDGDREKRNIIRKQDSKVGPVSWIQSSLDKHFVEERVRQEKWTMWEEDR